MPNCRINQVEEACTSIVNDDLLLIVKSDTTPEFKTRSVKVCDFIFDGSIKPGDIEPDAIQNCHVCDNTLFGTKIKALTLHGNKLTRLSIQNDRIVDGTITFDKLNTTSLVTNLLSAGSITGEMLEIGSIKTQLLTAGSITVDMLSAGIINSTFISSSSIVTCNLDACSINADHICADEIEARHIKADAIRARHIDVCEINACHINSNTIQARHIASETIASGNMFAAGVIAASAMTTELVFNNNLQSFNFDGTIKKVNDRCPDNCIDAYNFDSGTEGYFFHGPTGTVVVNTMVAREGIISPKFLKVKDGQCGLEVTDDGLALDLIGSGDDKGLEINRDGKLQITRVNKDCIRVKEFDVVFGGQNNQCKIIGPGGIHVDGNGVADRTYQIKGKDGNDQILDLGEYPMIVDNRLNYLSIEESSGELESCFTEEDQIEGRPIRERSRMLPYNSTNFIESCKLDSLMKRLEVGDCTRSYLFGDGMPMGGGKYGTTPFFRIDACCYANRACLFGSGKVCGIKLLVDLSNLRNIANVDDFSVSIIGIASNDKEPFKLNECGFFQGTKDANSSYSSAIGTLISVKDSFIPPGLQEFDITDNINDFAKQCGFEDRNIITVFPRIKLNNDQYQAEDFETRVKSPQLGALIVTGMVGISACSTDGGALMTFKTEGEIKNNEQGTVKADINSIMMGTSGIINQGLKGTQGKNLRTDFSGAPRSSLGFTGGRLCSTEYLWGCSILFDSSICTNNFENKDEVLVDLRSDGRMYVLNDNTRGGPTSIQSKVAQRAIDNFETCNSLGIFGQVVFGIPMYLYHPVKDLVYSPFIRSTTQNNGRKFPDFNPNNYPYLNTGTTDSQGNL